MKLYAGLARRKAVWHAIAAEKPTDGLLFSICGVKCSVKNFEFQTDAASVCVRCKKKVTCSTYKKQ